MGGAKVQRMIKRKRRERKQGLRLQRVWQKEVHGTRDLSLIVSSAINRSTHSRLTADPRLPSFLWQVAFGQDDIIGSG
jgi:hypothetical protein